MEWHEAVEIRRRRTRVGGGKDSKVRLRCVAAIGAAAMLGASGMGAGSAAPAAAGTYWKCSPNQSFAVARTNAGEPGTLTMLQTTCLDREAGGLLRATVRVREDRRTPDDHVAGAARVELRRCRDHSIISANPRNVDRADYDRARGGEVMFMATNKTREKAVYAASWVGSVSLETTGGVGRFAGAGLKGQSTWSYTCGRRRPRTPAARPTPPERCVTQSWRGYISDPSSFTKDSFYRVTWSPRACPRGNGDWAADTNDPSVKTFAPARVGLMELELEKPVQNSSGTRWALEGRVRQCDPFAKLTGGCVTVAGISVGWRVSAGARKLIFDEPSLRRTEAGNSLYSGLRWTSNQL